MEKVCEFCAGLQPIVYCTADAAFLCLACDAKVHSANVLSNRHFRTLVCESCKQQPADMQCVDHWMILCHSCDKALHEAFPQHQKRTLSSYTGCPSAKHFAKLLGFDMNEFVTTTLYDQFKCSSHVFVDPSAASLNISRFSSSESRGTSLESPAISSASVISAECGMASSSQHGKIRRKDHLQQNTFLIMQQILDLEKLQLTEGSNQSSAVRREGCSAASSSLYNPSEKPDEFLDQYSRDLHGPTNDLQKLENPSQELRGEKFPSPISQLERMHGDPFWQCRSPTGSSQFWSQNLQELGICEELDRVDDYNIPDMDGTFCNFEELFGGDKDIYSGLLDDNNMDISASSSVHIGKSNHAVKFSNPPDQVHQLSRSIDSSLPIQSTCSAQFSLSHLSAESGGSDCLDSGHSGTYARGEQSSAGVDEEGTENDIRRCKGIRKGRSHGKQILLKAKTDTHKRIKVRFTKIEGNKSDTLEGTRSY
ncbi:hypothetical protein Ancab_021108 [Ancistrocladus abbreviatus]